jgi:hypothetical protein
LPCALRISEAPTHWPAMIRASKWRRISAGSDGEDNSNSAAHDSREVISQRSSRAHSPLYLSPWTVLTLRISIIARTHRRTPLARTGRGSRGSSTTTTLSDPILVDVRNRQRHRVGRRGVSEGVIAVLRDVGPLEHAGRDNCFNRLARKKVGGASIRLITSRHRVNCTEFSHTHVC